MYVVVVVVVYWYAYWYTYTSRGLKSEERIEGLSECNKLHTSNSNCHYNLCNIYKEALMPHMIGLKSELSDLFMLLIKFIAVLESV
jgi:hypothetical protein